MLVYTHQTSKKTHRQKLKEAKAWDEQQSRYGNINVSTKFQTLQQPRTNILRDGANDFKHVQSIKTDRFDTFKPKGNVYTGTSVIGIAVQHKSCLQPIFSNEAARDSAAMRR